MHNLMIFGNFSKKYPKNVNFMKNETDQITSKHISMNSAGKTFQKNINLRVLSPKVFDLLHFK